MCLASTAMAGNVQVQIVGLRSAEGDLRVALCSELEFLEAGCALGGIAPAAIGKVVVEDVPPGRYAVQAHHDENENGRLDRTKLGRPSEGFGFSRDAPMRFGPPRYSDAVVEVPAEGGVLSITMRYVR